MKKIGEIGSKTELSEFEFIVQGNVEKSDYIVAKQGKNLVYAQVIEMFSGIFEGKEVTIGKANIIGYLEDGVIQKLRRPLKPKLPYT